MLIGAYAKRAYLGENFNMDLTETVRGYHSYFPKYFPISHPSPTNRFWMAKNRWFNTDVLPDLQQKVKLILS